MSSKTIVLIAEDSRDDCWFMQRAFEPHLGEFEVHFVGDGAEAIDYLDGRGKYADREEYPFPSLLVTDLRMPKVDGFALIDWIRSQPQLEQLPIAVFTVVALPSHVEFCKQLNVRAVLSKDMLIDVPTVFVNYIRKCARRLSLSRAEEDALAEPLVYAG
jgi:CheY-like chemotaxis protein